MLFFFRKSRLSTRFSLSQNVARLCSWVLRRSDHFQNIFLRRQIFHGRESSGRLILQNVRRSARRSWGGSHKTYAVFALCALRVTSELSLHMFMTASVVSMIYKFSNELPLFLFIIHLRLLFYKIIRYQTMFFLLSDLLKMTKPTSCFRSAEGRTKNSIQPLWCFWGTTMEFKTRQIRPMSSTEEEDAVNHVSNHARKLIGAWHDFATWTRPKHSDSHRKSFLPLTRFYENTSKYPADQSMCCRDCSWSM